MQEHDGATRRPSQSARSHDSATKRGNGVIRGVTRRRHADSQLLKVHNPHRHQCRRYCEAGETGGDCTAWPHRCAAGNGRTATGNKGGAEARQNSPNKNRAGPLPVQNSPSTPLLTACAVQNSPCSLEMALFGTFFARRANFVPFSPASNRAWRTLYRMRGRDGSSHHSTPGPTGVEGAGGTGGTGCGARGRWRGPAPEKSHVIRLGEVSTKSENVAIPTI